MVLDVCCYYYQHHHYAVASSWMLELNLQIVWNISADTYDFTWLLTVPVYNVLRMLYLTRACIFLSTAEAMRHQIGLTGWLTFFVNTISGESIKGMNFKLCMQIACGFGSKPIYFFFISSGSTNGLNLKLCMRRACCRRSINA